ncbi:hypothetical protein E27107_90281 [Elizabethkingia anophelis]|nr:hypothetical protein E18064_60431 [Elizabethkingia anophelis]CDN80193.1 hypothetical protein E27107_90281 [Elizabethkingia anophelis]
MQQYDYTKERKLVQDALYLAWFCTAGAITTTINLIYSIIINSLFSRNRIFIQNSA